MTDKKAIATPTYVDSYILFRENWVTVKFDMDILYPYSYIAL